MRSPLAPHLPPSRGRRRTHRRCGSSRTPGTRRRDGPRPRASGGAGASPAPRYHERTKPSFQGVRASPHFLDWDIMPRPFKVYPDLEPISLPRDVTTSTRPALAAIADPGTATGTGPRLDRAALARLFYFSA